MVQGRTLDSILNEKGIDQVDLIKIDVEGAELAVLEGSERTLGQETPLRIIIESLSEEPLSFLKAKGFKISRIGSKDYVAERN